MLHRITKMFTYVVSYSARPDGVPVHRMVTVTDKRRLLAEALTCFGLKRDKNFEIEVRNEKYGVFVRPMNPAQIPDEGCLRIVYSDPDPQRSPADSDSCTPLLRPTISTAETIPVLTLEPTTETTTSGFVIEDLISLSP